DAQKLRAFKLHLRSGSIAKQWWTTLLSTNKDTWEHLLLAFKARWPKKMPTVKTVEEKQTALERMKIMEEEVSTQIKVLGIEEFTHVVWADKIEKLAIAIPDMNGLLIGNIRKVMPRVLQKVTGCGHPDWASFCRAIRTVSLAQIEEAKEEEKEAQNLKEQVKKLQDLCNMLTQGITNTLQRLTMNTPTPTPCFPIPQNQNPHMQNHSPAPGLSTNNPFATLANPNNQNQTTYRQQRPPAEQWVDVVWLALPIHPNTPARRTLYNTQISQWNINHPRQLVSEQCLYPLSPSTAPVTSRECWKCSMVGHLSPNCDSPHQIPAYDRWWRSIVAMIKHSCPPTMTKEVNYFSTNPWVTKEEYNQKVIADFLAEQGKESGSSA
ncbi:hypothetical protein L208DRAFT_1285833, partial [Tricholoma matsutake]